MSKSWEEVAELTGGEMVGGSLIVATGHATRTSYGHFIDGQFVYTLEGLAFLRELEAQAGAQAVAPEGEPTSEPSDELVLEPVLDEAGEAGEAEVEKATQPSLEDLLG